jgi:hypothetical protein
MNWRLVIPVLLAVAASTQDGFAADPRFPDWPCAQAKVPEISLAAVWAGPPLDEAEKTIAEFLTGTVGADKTATGKLLFAGLFDTLNAQRSSVMNGLERVMRKQREVVDRVRSDTIALQELQSAPSPDQAKIDELGNQLNWETRIFEDRRRVVKFVCEVPTAIDQRLFALGRAIQQDIE